MGAGGDAVRLVAGQGGGSTQGNHYPEVMQWRGVPGGFSLSPMGSHVVSAEAHHDWRHNVFDVHPPRPLPVP